mmetsp:Transcript_34305/g.53508  ORF Transcript_34305/g.53508 Transcript_34305/m.53508 type:complete len:155 (+) Transcript_34305:937-1401(+)
MVAFMQSLKLKQPSFPAAAMVCAGLAASMFSGSQMQSVTPSAPPRSVAQTGFWGEKLQDSGLRLSLGFRGLGFEAQLSSSAPQLLSSSARSPSRPQGPAAQQISGGFSELGELEEALKLLELRLGGGFWGLRASGEQKLRTQGVGLSLAWSSED